MTEPAIPDAMVEVAAMAMRDRALSVHGELWATTDAFDFARAALTAALALCPVREEWASEHFIDASDHVLLETGADEGLARLRTKAWRENRPNYTTALVRRSVLALPWVPVEESADDERT
jgi:hypothetical protein